MSQREDDRAKREKGYEALSPFELKDKLIEMASSDSERMMLNAGRGNPNWVAVNPRSAFFQLGMFALEESGRNQIRPQFGGPPAVSGIAKRLHEYTTGKTKDPGIHLLREAVSYVEGELGIDPDAFVFEMVDAILGDHYPTPDRMLTYSEQVVHAYVVQEMCGGEWKKGRFDLFATEGGTAAMAYIFNSLAEQHLLHKGDKIALGTPIFTPYLEIPRLNDYELVELDIKQEEGTGWRYPESEIQKLADPAVKAFFLVHPSNPTSVAMHPEALEAIGKIAKERDDLIILTDDVYGTFVNGFRSLAAAAPYNTILVYSFSKYFGATGWRLGVIGIHQDNVFDKRIAALPASARKELDKRYSTVVKDPPKMKLIDRLVADSRAVALHHTAGLSTPQQVQMVLMALSALIDRKGDYKATAQDIVKKRFESLYEALGVPAPQDPLGARYYTVIDVPQLAASRYEKAFSDWLVDQHEPIDFVWLLAKEKGVVLMDGGGFDAPEMSVRVSLANLPDEAYAKIGSAISDLLEEYHARWQSAAT